MLTKNSIKGVFHPVFYISRLFGMFPYTDDLERSLVGSAFSVFVLVLIAGNIFLYGTTVVYANVLVHRSLLCYVVLLSISVVFNILESCRSRGRWRQILRYVTEIEDQIKQTEVVFSYSRLYVFLDLLIRAVFILNQLLIQIIRPMKLRYSSLVAFNLTDIIINWVEVEHLTFVSYVGYCFSVVSRSMKKDNAVQLIKLHRSLVEVTYQSRSLFNLKVFNSMVCLYASLLLDLYLILMPQWKARNAYSYAFLVNRFIQKSYELWKHVKTLNWFYRKEKQFNYKLLALTMEDKDDYLCNENAVKNQLSMKYQAVYSAADFFVLDCPVLHSVYATVTNYLTLVLGLS